MKLLQYITRRNNAPKHVIAEQLEFALPGTHLTHTEVSFLADLRRLRAKLIAESATPRLVG